MQPELIARLARDLAAADYRIDRIEERIGAPAQEALLRGSRAEAERRLASGPEDALTVMIRLLMMGESTSVAALDLAFPTLMSRGAADLGLVGSAGGSRTEFRPLLSLNPVSLGGEWWIISDLDDHVRGGPARPDHVMGVGQATRSLVAQAPLHLAGTELGGTAVDIGTGCGIVALILAKAGFGHVIATDVSERALRMARANAELNGCADRIDFRLGHLCEPVAGESVDLILSNPPFVITPRAAPEVPRFEYRDAGLPGDAIVQELIETGPGCLGPDGTLLCLANWESHWGETGRSRIAQWIRTAAERIGPLGAWVIERDRVSGAQYAETWIRDGGVRAGDPEFDALLGDWLEDFATRRVVGISLGSVRLRRLAHGETTFRIEEAPGAFAADPGPMLERAFATGIEASRADDAQLLAQRWVRDSGVREMREYVPGAEHPRAIALETDTPIARRITADPLLAAALGACDGSLELGRIAAALATLLDVERAAAEEVLVESFRELSWLGMVVPSTR